MPVRDVVSQMCNADVVGFSIYVWNANISLEAARRLKQERPDVVIVFGGPQVPDKPEQFLREHRFIDIVVHNEGERTFLNLIERLPERNWEGLAGVSFLDAEGRYLKAQAAERIRDLDEAPPPASYGTFDHLTAADPAEHSLGPGET